MTDSTKNAAPEVSAVIPFYRNVGWLCEAVESVLAQDLGDVEIIVVNDGSPEDVSELLDRFGGRIRYFERKTAAPPLPETRAWSRRAENILLFWIPTTSGLPRS